MNRQHFTSLGCAVALVAGNLAAFGQQAGQQPPKIERQIIINQNGVVQTFTDEKETPPGDVMIRRFAGPGQQSMVVTPGPGGEVQTFSFVSSEMSFESKVVKGAPYTADAVQEHIQVLADGNRIINRSTSQVARDSEGRTRREQSFLMVGPWMGNGEAPKTIFINDPVANVNYILDTKTKTARKIEFRVRFNGSPALLPGRTPEGGIEDKPIKVSRLGRPENVVKRVQPLYPAVAKAAGVEGPVKVQVLVGEGGRVVSAEVLDGPPLLRDAALDAARQWEFKPYEVDGKPVKVRAVTTFNFTLDKRQSAQAEQAQTFNVPKPPPTPGTPSAPPMVWAQEGGQISFAHLPAAGKPEVKTEDLGKQTIEGVLCEGKRTTVTIPAGEIGNDRPIEIVSERWFSPELQVVIMTETSDPRFGKNTYRLQNIIRAEPSLSLFQVPSDYTVKEGPAFAPGAPGTFEYRFERRNNEEKEKK